MTEMLDRIVCINSEGNCLLQTGVTYTVSGIARNYFESGDGVFLLEVEQCFGTIPFYSWRFAPTHEPVEQSQNNSFVDEREPV